MDESKQKMLEAMNAMVRTMGEAAGIEAVILIVQFDDVAVVESMATGGKIAVRKLMTKIAKQILEQDPINRGDKPQ